MISLSKDDFSFIGTDLIRPECVVATKKGDLFASHAGKQGGIVKLANSGGQEFILAKHGDIPEGFVPNGFALLPDGSFLIANVGDQGGVYGKVQKRALGRVRSGKRFGRGWCCEPNDHVERRN